MAAFFDSPPTNQSRLLTFRCPSYQQGANARDHLITIAWKAKDPRYGAEIMLLVENMPYRGKTLVLTPMAIKGQKLNVFPVGTFFTTCSCLPRKNGKVCYIATETIDSERAMVQSLDVTKRRVASGEDRSTKKISKDLQASTQILIQLYDFLEEFTSNQKRAQSELLHKIELLEQRYLELVAQNLSDKLAIIERKLLYLEQKTIQSNEHLQRQLQMKIDETHCYLNVLLARLVRKEKPTDAEISDFEKVLLEQRPADEEKILAALEIAGDTHLDVAADNSELLPEIDISQDATVMVALDTPRSDSRQADNNGNLDADDFAVETAESTIAPELAMILEDQPEEEDQPDNVNPYQGMGVTKIMESARFKVKNEIPNS